MTTRFEERLRAAREEERRKQLQSERRDRIRIEQQVREQREARDKALREQEREARDRASQEQQRAERQAEQARFQWQEKLRKTARQQEVGRLQQQLQSAQQAAAARSEQQNRQRTARLEQKQETKQTAERARRPGGEKRVTIQRESRGLRRQEKFDEDRSEKRISRRQSTPQSEPRRPPVFERKREQTARVVSQPPKKQPASREPTVTRPQREEKRRVARSREEQPQGSPRLVTEKQRQQRRQKAAGLRRMATRQAKSEGVKKTGESRRPAPAFKPRREPQSMRRQAAVRAVAIEPPPLEEPSGSLSWLKARGSFLVDELANAVYLRGVSCNGLDTLQPAPGQTLASSLALDDANLSTMTELWGINLIRLPFHAQTVLSGNSFVSANELLSGLDEIVAAVTEVGCYVLLSMEPSEAEPAPGSETFGAWSLLANHYQDEPGMLFDISSGPFPAPNDWVNTVAMLVGTIRLQNPAALIFVSNGRVGADVTELPLRFSTGDPVPNLVYAINVSPGSLPGPADPQLRVLSTSYPVFACPWSDGGMDFGRSSEETANLFERYGIGLVASSWNSDPRLVVNGANHDFAPTRWGLVVRRAISQPVKPLLPSLRVEDEASNAWRLGG